MEKNIYRTFKVSYKLEQDNISLFKSETPQQSCYLIFMDRISRKIHIRKS